MRTGPCSEKVLNAAMPANTVDAPVYTGTTGEPYITTLQTPSPGFAVAIPSNDGSGKFHRRNFQGGSSTLDEHLAQAKVWRNETYLRLYGKPPPLRVFHSHQENSSTGVPGVRFVIRKIRSRHNRNLTYEVPVFLAEVWLQPGRDGMRPRRSRSRQFSVAKWGHEEAFQLAVAWRTQAQLALEQGESLP